MAILLNNIQTKVEIDNHFTGLLERTLEAGLNINQKTAAEVSIVLVDDGYIQQLNSEYRGIDQPTDVLSFAIQEDQPDTPLFPKGGMDLPELLGDIFISVERAVEQADSYGHSLEREFCYLAIHGLLHLLGFDHQTTEQTEQMRQAEERILSQFDLNRT